MSILKKICLRLVEIVFVICLFNSCAGCNYGIPTAAPDRQNAAIGDNNEGANLSDIDPNGPDGSGGAPEIKVIKNNEIKLETNKPVAHNNGNITPNPRLSRTGSIFRRISILNKLNPKLFVNNPNSEKAKKRTGSLFFPPDSLKEKKSKNEKRNTINFPEDLLNKLSTKKSFDFTLNKELLKKLRDKEKAIAKAKSEHEEKVESLNKQIEEHSQHKNATSQQLEDEKEKNKNLEKSHEQKISELGSLIKNLEAEKEKLGKQFEEIVKDRENKEELHKEGIKNKGNEIEDIKSLHSNEINTLKEKLNSLSEENTKINETILLLEKNNEKLEEAHEKYRQESQIKLENTNRISEENIVNLNKEASLLKEQIKKSNEESETKVNKLTTEKIEANLQIEELKRKASIAALKYTTDLDTIKEEFEGKTNKLNKDKEALEKDKEILKEENENIRFEKSKIESDLTSKISILNEKLKSNDEESENLQRELDILKKGQVEITKENVELKQQIEIFRNQIEKHEEISSTMLKSVRLAKDKNSTDLEKLSQLEAQIERDQQSYNEKLNEFNTIIVELNKKQEISAKENLELTELMEVERGKNKNIIIELEKSKTESQKIKSELEGKNQKLTQNLAAEKNKNTAIETKNNQITIENTKLKKENEEIAIEMAEAKSKVAIEQQLNKKLDSEKQALVEGREKLTTELDETKKNLLEKNNENKLLSEESGKKEEKLKAMLLENKETGDYITELKKINDLINSMNKDLDKNNKELLEKVGNLSKENENLKTQLSDKDNELSELRIRLNTMTSQQTFTETEINEEFKHKEVESPGKEPNIYTEVESPGKEPKERSIYTDLRKIYLKIVPEIKSTIHRTVQNLQQKNEWGKGAIKDKEHKANANALTKNLLELLKAFDRGIPKNKDLKDKLETVATETIKLLIAIRALTVLDSDKVDLKITSMLSVLSSSPMKKKSSILFQVNKAGETPLINQLPITKYLLLYAGSADDANFSKDLCFISMGNILNQFIEYIDSNNDYPPIGNLLILLNKPKLSPSKSPLLRKKATIGNDDKLLKKEVGRSSFMDIFKDMKDKLAKNEDQKDKKK